MMPDGGGGQGNPIHDLNDELNRTNGFGERARFGRCQRRLAVDTNVVARWTYRTPSSNDRPVRGTPADRRSAWCQMLDAGWGRIGVQSVSGP